MQIFVSNFVIYKAILFLNGSIGLWKMAEPKRIISLVEVKEHSTAKSLWLAIHNKVYDVTKFMDEVFKIKRRLQLYFAATWSSKIINS